MGDGYGKRADHSGEFDEVEDPDEEEESESRGVSPSGMSEAMEGASVGGKGKATQAEASQGKVDRVRVCINANIVQGVRSEASEPRQSYALHPSGRE